MEGLFRLFTIFPFSLSKQRKVCYTIVCTEYLYSEVFGLFQER